MEPIFILMKPKEAIPLNLLKAMTLDAKEVSWLMKWVWEKLLFL
jgi:hypothetical protein